MTYTPPVVSYAATQNGTYYNLSGVQSISITMGRQRFQDNFGVTTCTIEIIPPATFSLALAVGQAIDVRKTNGTTTPCYFQGRITDIQRIYGMPYNAGTGAAPADRIVITATGATGALGANTANNASWTGGRVYDALTSIDITVNANITWGIYDDSGVQVSSGTMSNSYLDFANQMVRSAQLVFGEFDATRNGSSMQLLFMPYGFRWATPIKFSDTGAPGTYKMKRIEFRSSAMTTFNRVTVEPEGLANQVVQTGLGPYNNLLYKTYNSTTGAALNLANYLLLTQAENAATPFVVGSDTTVNTAVMDIAIIPNIFNAINPPITIGAPVQTTFRGTTANASIEGINSNFYPDYASVQVYLSPSLGIPFVLDSASSGVLDTNRLAFP
jgi:hypothetical protein